jgi:hypothetical protein
MSVPAVVKPSGAGFYETSQAVSTALTALSALETEQGHSSRRLMGRPDRLNRPGVKCADDLIASKVEPVAANPSMTAEQRPGSASQSPSLPVSQDQTSVADLHPRRHPVPDCSPWLILGGDDLS